jgi:GT2 family glycosyltransferase
MIRAHKVKAYCDQFTNVIHIDREFINKNAINSIDIETVDKKLGIKLDPQKVQEKSKTIEIVYPPTKNLKSNSIKITYLREDNEFFSSEIINYQPWSLHIESTNARTVSGWVIKNPNFVIRPVKLSHKGGIVPYRTELIKRKIKDNGMENHSFKWHLQKDHNAIDIIEAVVDNHGSLCRIKYLARANDFSFVAEWVAKNKNKSIKNRKSNYNIAILMPIYNGIPETIEAIESILAHYQNNYADSGLSIRLILGLDNPNNHQMRGNIEEKYQKNSQIDIINNASNLGFIQNCNQMFERVEQDEEVILINSDVICPNKNWIRELIDVSEMSDKIGTVTPMSNCASIFSFPFPNHDNAFVTPDHLEEVNEALNSKIDNILMVPSCHGFCVLIRKTRLPFQLRLDPVFGKGYGEENDLSMKIQMTGLKNVACPSVFVYHHESISFSGDKTPLLRKNLKLLGERYPSYHKDVQHWIAKDLLKQYRNDAIKRMLGPNIDGQKTMVHISHSRGGGTQEYIENIISQNKEYNHVIIASSKKLAQRCTLSIATIENNELLSQLKLETNEVDIIHEFHWLQSLCIVERIIIHSLVDFAHPSETLGFLLELDCAREIIIHDYEWISPNQNLLDKDMKAVPVRQSETLFSLDRIDKKIVFSESLKQHQIEREYFLLSKSNKICPSEAAHKLVRECYPKINNVFVKYHDSSGDYLETAINQSLDRLQTDGVRLAIIGAIGSNKGFKLLCEIARNVFINKNRIEMVVIGYTADDSRLTSINPNIIVTGKYNGKEELEGLLEIYKPNSSLFLSPWPETYSYTLSIAFEYRLWPFVLNYGAIAERVVKSKFGDILLSETPNDIIKQIEQRTGA